MTSAQVGAEGEEHAATELEEIPVPVAEEQAPAPQKLSPSKQPSPRPVRPRPTRKPLPAGYVVAIWALLSLAGLSAWGVIYGFALSSVQEHRTQHVLHAKFRGELADGTAPVGAKIARGAPVAMLQIPRIGLRDLMVVEGTTSTDLQAGPGHRRDTPLPGEIGASFVMGRSRTFGAPFAHIVALKKGDPITVRTGEGTFHFSVDAVRRPGDSLTELDPGAARLTLVTSEGVKGGTRQAVYVDATMKDKAQPAPEGLPTSLPVAEKQMRGDQGALIAIVLLLLPLLLAIVALSWTRVRWGLRPTLVVGIPVVLATVWGVTETVSQLLPNVF
jgi:sortase A